MTKRMIYLLLAGMGCFLITVFNGHGQGTTMVESAYSIDRLRGWFTVSAEQLQLYVADAIVSAQKDIDTIIAIPNQNRTFENTFQAYDCLNSISDLSLLCNLCALLELVSPKKEIRDAAHDSLIKAKAFLVDHIRGNKALYFALKKCTEIIDFESLRSDEKYFIEETLTQYEIDGMALSDERLAEVNQLKRDIDILGVQFERNISEDTSCIIVDRKDLEGVSDTVIDSFECREDGKYRLGMDYPTVGQVMSNCRIEETRKRMSRAFANRGYPINEKILQEIVEKRIKLANILGFETFAHLNLVDQMIQSPEQAESFLKELAERSTKKVAQELKSWTAKSGDLITPLEDGRLKSWDTSFCLAQYKKSAFNIDEEHIAEYFPLEKTLAGLMKIYESFFDLRITQIPAGGFWHEDVLCMQISDKAGTMLLGTIFLDLHPREGKFSHACEEWFIPAHVRKGGERIPAVSVVVANFPKSTKEKPALLKRGDVTTFFHEFGHAIHVVLGATKIVSFSGASVKQDFVELPSQILEEWLWSPEILKMVSSHYQTGEPLDDETIANIIALKTFDSGFFVQRQVYFSLYSLYVYKTKEPIVLYDLLKKIYSETVTYTVFDEDHNHMYANFGHLYGYDARYYGYLWSRVLAADVFEEIKKVGLLNPEIGRRYADIILCNGGSCDPNQLLERFLSRKPTSAAFFESMNL